MCDVSQTSTDKKTSHETPKSNDKNKVSDETQDLNNKLKDFDEGPRVSLSMVKKSGEWAVNNTKFNDRLLPQNQLITAMNKLSEQVTKLIVSNENTQKVLDQHMTALQEQSSILKDLDSRLKKSEENHVTLESKFGQQAEVIYAHDAKLDELEQLSLEKDLLLSGPIIEDLLKSNPSMKFGCPFSEPDHSNKISAMLNSELANVAAQSKQVSITSYSKFKNSTLMVSFGSGNEKLYLIRTLAKNKTEEGRNIFLNERLTKFRQQVHYELRNLKKKAPKSGLRVLIRNGCPSVSIAQWARGWK